jgi:hypothetical protein
VNNDKTPKMLPNITISTKVLNENRSQLDLSTIKPLKVGMMQEKSQAMSLKECMQIDSGVHPRHTSVKKTVELSNINSSAPNWINDNMIDSI